MNASIYAIATFDTKGHELAYVAARLRALGAPVVTVDVGTLNTPVVVPDVLRERVRKHLPAARRQADAAPGDRAAAIAEMSAALVEFLRDEFAAGRVAGAMGLGGGGGTSLIAPALRILPIGVPKLLVSTMAAGNVAPYVGASDLVMMHSVLDVAGLNSVSRRILANAAHAMYGMVVHSSAEVNERPTVAMTMFGVTTPCVERVRVQLEARGFDPLVFHATGAGGRAMEQLIDAGLVVGVLDITTTEIADELFGGVLSAGPARLDAALERRIPQVLSVGALDMVNFGGRETVPDKHASRRLHAHNAQVTLIRTTVDENRAIGRWMVDKLRGATSPIVVLLPEGGVSAIDAPGQPFHDPAADAALFETLEEGLREHPYCRVLRVSAHINDATFADRAVNEFMNLWLATKPSS
ncbi:MAG: Tm-1-like ATP-binding domain-containing protein [Planctomycetes bacterium]|nr:Tm-1-like ATP-binding domain-containing protein [Planctomycetota bacterium]